MKSTQRLMETLWSNLKYFLEKIIPVAEENDKMAIHPDDPPFVYLVFQE